MGTLLAIVVSIISLVIFFYVIKGAIKEAVDEKITPFLKIYSVILRHQAKQAGMQEWEIDKEILTEKEYKKKYKGTTTK